MNTNARVTCPHCGEEFDAEIELEPRDMED